MIINVKTTPNPNAMQFIVPERWINFSWECKNEKDAAKSPLAQKLWQIEGVKYLMFSTDFVSIIKDPDLIWEILQPDIIESISEFIISGLTLFETDDVKALQKLEKESRANPEREYTELEKQMITALEDKVQPAIELHGGMVKFEEFKDGILLLDMQGACKDCPSSLTTLKDGIENLMKYYFPEIIEVKHV